MALKATIFKATLNIADMDRHYYGDHHLTIARHPSETDERMMIRLLAFILNASENLEFTKGISTDDEPDLWQKSLSDEIELWIELGLPADKVILYTYGGRAVPLWWEKHQGKLTRFDNLTIIDLPADDTESLAALAERGMNLQCTVQDGSVNIGNDDTLVSVTPDPLYPE